MSQTQVERPSSEEEDPNIGAPKKEKSRRPPNTAFRQQRLKAWQPILTPKTVIPLFFAIGVIFAPIGGLLLWSSAKVQELTIDYTHCTSDAPLLSTDSSNATIPSKYITSSFRSSNTTSSPLWYQSQSLETPPYGVQINTSVCTLQFEIPNDMGPPVFLYYRLTNFFQNHRRYVKSLDTDQLLGKVLSNKTISNSDCNPLRTDHSGKAYYPCGLIANSLFNDTFKAPIDITPTSGANVTYNMTNQGIAWSHDKSIYKKTSYTRDQVVPPPNWALRYPDGYTAENDIPDLSQYEEFQNWMRTAGLPTFSKLALRNDHELMAAGTYQMTIFDYFPVTEFGGTKTIVLSTRTVMGGKNPFLGIAYVVIGGLCIVLGALFTVAHLVRPRKLGDHTYLSWNNDQPSTATATGRDVRPGPQ